MSSEEYLSALASLWAGSYGKVPNMLTFPWETHRCVGLAKLIHTGKGTLLCDYFIIDPGGW